MAALSDVRTGNGFDVHAFGDGDHVMLAGVRIPNGRGVTGHSDADVALHALVDAILGALAEGDIGVHFPPSLSLIHILFAGETTNVKLTTQDDFARAEVLRMAALSDVRTGNGLSLIHI